MNTREFVGVLLLTVPIVYSARVSADSLSPATAPRASGQERSAVEVEAAIRAFYKNLKLYNLEAMKAAMTPDFEISVRGQEMGGTEFLKRHAEEERVSGPTASRPERMKYELVDFKIVVTPEMAISTSREIDKGNSYYDVFVLKRSEDKWLIHRLFHVLVQAKANPVDREFLTG